MSLSLHLIFTVCLRLKTLDVLINLIPGFFLEFYCLLSTFVGYIGWLLSVDCLLSSLSALNLLQFVTLVVLLLISRWFDPPGCLLSLWYWLDSSSQLSSILSHA